jgi:hypothetical protein
MRLIKKIQAHETFPKHGITDRAVNTNDNVHFLKEVSS